MNTTATKRPTYARIALFSCVAVVLAMAVWRMAFAGPSPFVDAALAQEAQQARN